MVHIVGTYYLNFVNDQVESNLISIFNRYQRFIFCYLFRNNNLKIKIHVGTTEM